MDYDKQLRDIDNLIAEGMYPQAVRTAGSVLEHLYKELYRDLLGKMPPGERDAVSKQEQRIGKDRGINDFTLGMVAGLYREANLVPKLEQHLDHKLPFMRSFNPGHFIDLRNRATHANAEISVEEAQLLLGQLRVLLKEVGKVAPPRPKEPTSTAMMLKPWTQVVQPHEDIQRGELAMDTYAADLWAVYRKDPDSAGVYRDANAFLMRPIRRKPCMHCSTT
ncbi:MAG: hypothetical protein M5R40_07010 [Anaerolineae bacterium]|nr:hypothetical protein [Anaerolineae bacterium]